MDIRFNITATDFAIMRESVAWKKIELSTLQKALDNSMFVVGIYIEDEIIAMGRIVGDKVFKSLLTDIMVKPKYQKHGYGKIVVTKLIELTKNSLAPADLMCIEASPTKGNIPFYVNCGMTHDTEEQEGVYLWLKGNEITFNFEKENNRAVAILNDKIIGVCEYSVENRTWNIFHTEVSTNYQGMKIAQKLVNLVIENAYKNNVKVVATCSYAKKILENL